MAEHPRGIDPALLVSQIQNTMPYLFAADREQWSVSGTAPAKFVLSWGGGPLSHAEYFRLCLSAHYLTCATPVPTDVDNQIRKKLWPRDLALASALDMADLVLESHDWDFSAMSSRWVKGATGSSVQDVVLSGHLGEWFTVAAGAYAALRQYAAPEAKQKAEALLEAIAQEVLRHAEVFGSLWRENQGIAALKAAATIAHNLGDLDRVMDFWELSPLDPLRSRFYQLDAVPFDSTRNLRSGGRLWVAGQLYKELIDGSSMAFENHRHFALRVPRSLRKRPEVRIPLGPFLDDWAKTLLEFLDPTELSEVFEALQSGWKRLPKTLGYGRALRVLSEARSDLKVDREVVKAHAFRKTLEQSQARFEKKWNDEALRLMDEIPGRA